MGMALFETKAIFEGLFSNDATFLTTPKEGSSKGASSANSVKRQSLDDILAMSGMLIGFGRLFVLLHFKSFLGSFHDGFVLVMSLMTGISLIWVNVSFLQEKHSQRRTQTWMDGRLLYLFLMLSLITYKMGLLIY